MCKNCSCTPFFKPCSFVAQETHIRPAAIYKTHVSILIQLLLYGPGIAVFVLPIIYSDVLWVKILCGVVIAFLLWVAVHLLRYWNDRIIVSPAHLSIPHVAKKTRNGEWGEVGKAVIPWNDIRDISSQFDVSVTNHLSIQKEVIIRLKGGILYSIDSDLYDVFFLERKLKAFWHKYSNSHPSRKTT